MKRFSIILLVLLAQSLSMLGQSAGGKIVGARPWRAGTTLPATCIVGDGFFLTSGTIGLYECTSANTWSDGVTSSAVNILVDQQPGANFCAKMASCEAALLALGGGTCDARNVSGTQSCAQMVFSTNQVRHLFGDINLTLTGNPGLNWTASGSTLEGASLFSTQFITNSATADLIKLSSAAAQNRLSDFLLQSSVARSAGAGLRVQGGNNTFERVQLFPIWDGIVLDTVTTGDNNVFDKIYYGVSSGGGNSAHHCAILNGGAATGQVASNTFRSMTILSSSASSFTDAAICLQDGSDSITIADSQIVANVGFTDSVMLHLEQVNGGNAPSNIKISNVTLEGGVTKNAVVIDSADGIDFYNATAQSSLRGILVNAGNRVHWNGGLLYNNQDEGAKIVAATDFTLIGARLQNNSQAANNTFDDIFMTAGSAAISSFVISDNNFTRRGAPANLSKWNIELPAGNTDNYTITGNVTPATAFATGAITDGGTGLNKFVCNGTNGCSSVVAAPDGTATAPGQTFASHRTIGWFLDSNLSMQLGFNGAGPLLNGTQVGLGTGMELCWASGSDPNNTACDTSVSRDAAGVIDIGTGAVGNTAGTVKANKLQSVVATGTAPLVIASTTLVPNLNTQILNGVTVSGTPSTGQGIIATSASAAGWQAVGGSFSCVNVTPVTVSANTAADQTLMACTIPAGTLNLAGKTLSIQSAGIYSTPAASSTTVNLKVKLCTVSGCGSGTVITLVSLTSAALGAIQATNDPFNFQAFSSTQTAGASSAYEAHGNLTIDTAALTTAAEGVYADGNTATVGTIDSTAQLFLQVTGAFSAASASNSMTHRMLTIESLN